MIFPLISGYDETCSFSDLGSSVVKVLSMFTGEFSFEDVLLKLIAIEDTGNKSCALKLTSEKVNRYLSIISIYCYSN